MFKTGSGLSSNDGSGFVWMLRMKPLK